MVVADGGGNHSGLEVVLFFLEETTFFCFLERDIGRSDDLGRVGFLFSFF